MTRASLVDAPHVAADLRGRADALIPVDAYRVSPASDVVEYLRVRTDPAGHPTELHYVPDAASRPGYYEIGTNNLVIDRPLTRSDLAVYQLGDLRRVGLIK